MEELSTEGDAAIEPESAGQDGPGKPEATPTAEPVGSGGAISDAPGADAPDAVVAKMKATRIDDFFARGGTIRADGRMVHEMYLVRVKKPSESKYPWDYYKLRATIPGDQAFRPLNEGDCPLVKK